MMAAGTRIITPSYRADIEQFALLRRSLELFAPRYEHLAIVHSEDYPVFHERFGRDARLQLVKTSEVLPLGLERRRIKGHRRLLKSLHKRLFGADLSGWHAQQLAKIHALAQCDSREAAFIDSDVFLCRPLADDYFRHQGRTKLFRRQAGNAELLDFDISTHVILGNPLHEVTLLYDYIFQPASFRPSSACALLQQLQARHGAAWVDRFLRERRPSEYNLLGYAATVLEHGRDYSLVDCNPQDLHHSIRFDEDATRLASEVEQCLRSAKPFFLVQSRLRLPFPLLKRAFDQVTQAATARQRAVAEDGAGNAVPPANI